MNKSGCLESFVWPGCMWLTHAFVAFLLFMLLVSGVPRFVEVMADYGAELPPVSQLVITLSHRLVNYWYLIVPFLLALNAAALFGLSQLPSNLRWLRSLWFNAIMVMAVLLFFITSIGVILPVAALQQNMILVGTRDTDSLVVHVDALTNLQGDDQDYFTDDDLGLSDLRVLNLSESDITDAGLERLTGLTQLELLYLFDTQVTPEGVEKLQQALPNCEILY